MRTISRSPSGIAWMLRGSMRGRENPDLTRFERDDVRPRARSRSVGTGGPGAARADVVGASGTAPARRGATACVHVTTAGSSS
jgi:hypothetical protein